MCVSTSDALKNLCVGDHGMKFITWQLERGAENSRLHIQAYVEFSRSVRRIGVHSLFGRVVDCRPCDGSRESNIRYANKEDTRVDGPWTIGEGPQQGRRSDLVRTKALVDSGASDMELWDKEFQVMVRYRASIQAYSLARRLYATPEFRPLSVFVYWGSTGLGKSRRARHESGQIGGGLFCVDVPDKVGGSKWFDGYCGQKAMLLDDYGGEFGVNWFKRFLDGYPIQLAVKCSFVMRDCTHVFITSNKSPDDWYPEVSQADRDALRRRYTRVVHFSGPWTPDTE